MFILPGFQITTYRLGELREKMLPPLGHECEVLHHRRIGINARFLVFRLMKRRELGFAVAHQSAFAFHVVLEYAPAVVRFHDAIRNAVFAKHFGKGGLRIFHRARGVKHINDLIAHFGFVIHNGTKVIRARVGGVHITTAFYVCRCRTE